jgi:hypothetical protein
MSILSDSLQQQMNSVFEKLVASPNNLLLRCVQFSSQGLPVLNLNTGDSDFLDRNGIAVIDTHRDPAGRRLGTDFVVGFLSPWDNIFSELAEEMRVFRPEKMPFTQRFIAKTL